MNLTELRNLYDLFDGDREKVESAIKSIEDSIVTLEELINEEYYLDDGRYYSSNDYTMTHDGDIIPIDEAIWCEGYEEYYHCDECTRVYIHRDYEWYSIRYAENNSEWVYYEGDYYDNYALEYNDLVWVENEEEVQPRDHAFFHDSDGCYYSYPEDNETYVRGYHNGSYKTLNFDKKSKFKIGYEIEKEDQDIRDSIDIDDFENSTDDLWRKEEDGSLDSESGYELISPTFEFNIDKIFEHIESNNILVRHINADISHKCGGHIHLSEQGLTGNELFDKIKGYTPLFYALYYGRVDKHYCKGKNNDDLKNENEKYQAIKIHDDRIEFRIISAVPNVKTLKWRSKLLMMIIQNPTHDIIKAYYNVDTKFTKLLKQTYTDDKLIELKQRFIKFTRQFEDLDINNKN